MKKVWLAFAMMCCFALVGAAQAPPGAQPAVPAAVPAAPPAAAPTAVPFTDADLKAAVKATDRTNGDPDGALTGNATDIAVSDPKAGLTLTDVLNQIGANRIGVNFAWTLLCGFLIMFMQAGFAWSKPADARQERQPHDDELHGLRGRPGRPLPDRVRPVDGRRRVVVTSAARRF